MKLLLTITFEFYQI